MEKYEDNKKKAHEFREWYYGEDRPVPSGAESASDTFDLINGVLFGHIYQRDVVDTKTRSLCTIAALTVLDRDRQIGDHIKGALKLGATKEQIVEIITQLLFYGGYPCTVNALSAAGKAFNEYDKDVGE